MKYLSCIPLSILAGRGFCLAAFLFLVGCASPGTAPAGGAGPTGAHGNRSLDEVDKLRVGELLEIQFSGVTDPPLRHEERIKTDGLITLPNIGSIQAAGKTRGELEAEIHRRYVPNYYKQLTVLVRNEGRFFYVRGQVRAPGQFPYLKEMTVTKAIAVAGDFTDFAQKKRVQVTRADGRRSTVNVLKAIENPKLDLPIYPDDIIEVPRRYF